jgi:mRNA interferase MazF
VTFRGPVRRGDVILVNLDPVVGREIRRTRPCLVVSPDEMNRHLGTFIVAPMSTGGRPWPTRILSHFDGVEGHVVLDQLRTVDRQRLVRTLGRIPEQTRDEVLNTLGRMFAI